MSGYLRQIRLNPDETLRTIAARELGDPRRWPEIAQANQLSLPYITASYLEADRLPGTLIWGDRLYVPSATNSPRVLTPDDLLGVDADLSGGDLHATTGGDIAVVAGVPNLQQALRHRLKTLKTELVYHPEYGSYVTLALGMKATPVIELTAAGWARQGILEDPRTYSVDRMDATVDGDRCVLTAQATITGDNTPIDLNLSFNP